MANTATLAVKIVSDSAAARADIGKSSDAVGKWGDRATKVGRFAGRALAVGIGAAAAAAVKFTQAAAEDAASAQKLATTLRNAAGATDEQVAAVEKWIEAQGKALGVADDELRPALSRLTAATGDVAKAQKLAALAMDVSAGTGKSLQTVTEALQKAQNGSVGGLSRLGARTKNAAGETLSLTKITKDLASTYAGQAAKAADTAAGRQKRLSVAMGELQEKIGAKLLPVMEKLIDVGFKVIAWIDENQKLVGILVGTLGSFLAVVYVITKAIKVWTAVQAAFNAVMLINPVGLIVLAVVALVAAIVIAYKKSDTFRALVQKVGEVGRRAFEAIWNAIKPVISVIGEVVRWVAQRIPGAFDLMKRLVVGYLKIVTLPIRTLLDIVQAVYGWVQDKLPGAFSRFSDLLRRIGGAITKPFRVLKDLILDIWGWIQRVIDAARNIPKINSPQIDVAPDAGPVITPGSGGGPDTRTVAINVTVEGGIIGMSDATVGRALLDAINRGRRSAGLAPIG